MDHRETLTQRIERNRVEMTTPTDVDIDALLDTAAQACCDPAAEPTPLSATASAYSQLSYEQRLARILHNRAEMVAPHIDWTLLVERAVTVSSESTTTGSDAIDDQLLRNDTIDTLSRLARLSNGTDRRGFVFDVIMTVIGAFVIWAILYSTYNIAYSYALKGSMLLYVVPIVAIIAIVLLTYYALSSSLLSHRAPWVRTSAGALAGGCIITIIGYFYLLMGSAQRTTQQLTSSMLDQSVKAIHSIEQGHYPDTVNFEVDARSLFVYTPPITVVARSTPVEAYAIKYTDLVHTLNARVNLTVQSSDGSAFGDVTAGGKTLVAVVSGKLTVGTSGDTITIYMVDVSPTVRRLLAPSSDLQVSVTPDTFTDIKNAWLTQPDQIVTASFEPKTSGLVYLAAPHSPGLYESYARGTLLTAVRNSK